MDYEIIGEPFPVVSCKLTAGEKMICSGGAMCWMTPNITMETVGGGVGKIFGRMFSGESLFMNHYTAQSEAEISFSSKFPGAIIPLEITPDKPMILQKSAFLAATQNIDLSIHLQRKLGTALFGGEGFIMQKVSGEGTVFAEIDGFVKEIDLQDGQTIVVDTGYVAMMEHTCTMEIKTVPGVKNMLLGGEGVFNTHVTGPGKVYLQTAPVSNLAGALKPYFPVN